jgi:hypothetical protein
VPEEKKVSTKALRKLARTCAYCGGPGAGSDDHVPPKNVYGKPYPQGMIEVPACPACHVPCSPDDEYFRLKVCLSQTVGDDPTAKKNREVILKSLDREEAAGLRRKVAQDTRWVPVPSPGGLYLGHALAMDVDLPRIFSVIERTARGLYWERTRSPLPRGCDVKVISDDTLKESPRDVVEQLQQTILAPLMNESERSIAGVFKFRGFVMPDHQGVSVWLMTFYGRMSFVAMTGPADKMGQEPKPLRCWLGAS